MHVDAACWCDRENRRGNWRGFETSKHLAEAAFVRVYPDLLMRSQGWF